MAVLLGALLVAVISRNVVAGEPDEGRHEVGEYEGGTEEVPVGMVLMSAREPMVPDEQRHVVARWRGSSENVPLAAGDCRAIVTKDNALNRDGEKLFGIQVRATWCWRGGR